MPRKRVRVGPRKATKEGPATKALGAQTYNILQRHIERLDPREKSTIEAFAKLKYGKPEERDSAMAVLKRDHYRGVLSEQDWSALQHQYVHTMSDEVKRSIAQLGLTLSTSDRFLAGSDLIFITEDLELKTRTFTYYNERMITPVLFTLTSHSDKGRVYVSELAELEPLYQQGHLSDAKSPFPSYPDVVWNTWEFSRYTVARTGWKTFVEGLPKLMQTLSQKDLMSILKNHRYIVSVDLERLEGDFVMKWYTHFKVKYGILRYLESGVPRAITTWIGSFAEFLWTHKFWIWLSGRLVCIALYALVLYSIFKTDVTNMRMFYMLLYLVFSDLVIEFMYKVRHVYRMWMINQGREWNPVFAAIYVFVRELAMALWENSAIRGIMSPFTSLLHIFVHPDNASTLETWASDYGPRVGGGLLIFAILYLIGISPKMVTSLIGGMGIFASEAWTRIGSATPLEFQGMNPLVGYVLFTAFDYSKGPPWVKSLAPYIEKAMHTYVSFSLLIDILADIMFFTRLLGYKVTGSTNYDTYTFIQGTPIRGSCGSALARAITVNPEIQRPFGTFNATYVAEFEEIAGLKDDTERQQRLTASLAQIKTQFQVTGNVDLQLEQYLLLLVRSGYYGINANTLQNDNFFIEEVKELQNMARNPDLKGVFSKFLNPVDMYESLIFFTTTHYTKPCTEGMDPRYCANPSDFMKKSANEAIGPFKKLLKRAQRATYMTSEKHFMGPLLCNLFEGNISKGNQQIWDNMKDPEYRAFCPIPKK